MSNKILSLLIFPLFFSLSQFTLADVVLVVNPSSSLSSATLGDIRKLYLGKATSVPGGGKVKPLNQNVESSVRVEFDKTMLGKEPKQIKGYWAKMMFSGKGVPPEEVGNDAEVIAQVSSNGNLVGYVDAGSVTDAVKVVSVK